MGKRKKSDPLISVLERALDLGEFISYNRSWGFVRDLEDVKQKIDALVKDRQTERAVGLYEIFLSSCYEKADEIDDSGGNLGMFFEDLFCAWINARQKAKYNPEETVQNILRWMDNDDYGFCFEIERTVVKVLNKKSVRLFEAAIKSRFEKAFSKDHFRKYSFIGYFEEIVDRRPLKKPESFKARAMKRWKKQVS